MIRNYSGGSALRHCSLDRRAASRPISGTRRLPAISRARCATTQSARTLRKRCFRHSERQGMQWTPRPVHAAQKASAAEPEPRRRAATSIICAGERISGFAQCEAASALRLYRLARLLRGYELFVALHAAKVPNILRPLRGEGRAQGYFLAAYAAGNLLLRYLRTVWRRHDTPPSNYCRFENYATPCAGSLQCPRIKISPEPGALELASPVSTPD